MYYINYMNLLEQDLAHQQHSIYVSYFYSLTKFSHLSCREVKCFSQITQENFKAQRSQITCPKSNRKQQSQVSNTDVSGSKALCLSTRALPSPGFNQMENKISLHIPCVPTTWSQTDPFPCLNVITVNHQQLWAMPLCFFF